MYRRALVAINGPINGIEDVEALFGLVHGFDDTAVRDQERETIMGAASLQNRIQALVGRYAKGTTFSDETRAQVKAILQERLKGYVGQRDNYARSSWESSNRLMGQDVTQSLFGDWEPPPISRPQTGRRAAAPGAGGESAGGGLQPRRHPPARTRPLRPPGDRRGGARGSLKPPRRPTACSAERWAGSAA